LQDRHDRLSLCRVAHQSAAPQRVLSERLARPASILTAYRFPVRSASVIKSFADKRTAAPFAGYSVKAVPNQIQGRARAKLLAVDAANMICACRPAIGSKRCMATGVDNTASASTISGGYALNGASCGVECRDRGLSQRMRR
jgi:hypothetical protein